MKRRITLVHGAVLATFAGALSAGPGAATLSAQAAAAAAGTQAPMFSLEVLWPKPLPAHCVIGNVFGMAIDSRDHIFIANNGQFPAGQGGFHGAEISAAAMPPSGECCFPAPLVSEYDAAGNWLSGFDVPAGNRAYVAPSLPGGLAVDADGNVWLGGSGPTDNQILKFTKQGLFVMAIGKAAPGAAPAAGGGGRGGAGAAAAGAAPAAGAPAAGGAPAGGGRGGRGGAAGGAAGAAPAGGAPAGGAPAGGAAPAGGGGGRGGRGGAAGGAAPAGGAPAAGGAAGGAPAAGGRGGAGRGGAGGAAPVAMVSGGESNATDSFGGVADIAFDVRANEVYVADGYRNRRVVVLDMTTGMVKRYWGAYGNKPDDVAMPGYSPTASRAGQFNVVSCVVLANDGMVYVCDRGNDRIQVFKKDGSFVKEAQVAPATLGDGSVWDIALSRDATQKYLYVADGMNMKVHILDRASLTELTAFGDGGRYPGQFTQLRQIATDSRGNIITGDGLGRKIEKFNYRSVGAVTKKDQGTLRPATTAAAR